MHAPLILAVLLAAAASGSIMFPRNGCGCLRNPVAAELEQTEIVQLRSYIQERGVKHYAAFTDYSLQAIFRFNLLNNFPDIVPTTRAGVIEVVSESLKELTDSVVPSAHSCGQIAGWLKGSVPELAAGSVNIDLRSLVAATSVILYQRGVKIQQSQLNVLIKTGLSGYLQSSAYQTSYSALSQLIASLDHIDHNLPNILDQDSLRAIRRRLETRFNLDSKIFDIRFQQAVKVFESNRQKILDSFNTLAFRGADYEVNIQTVIEATIRLFPGASKVTLRSVLNILQLTNSQGGKAKPKDLLAMITIPHLDKSLRTITDVVANRIYLELPSYHHGITRVQVHEAYVLFIIGLASQGVQPIQLRACHDSFVWHTQRYFLGTRDYTVEAYILYVIRVVVPSIPRGSAAFRLHLFDASVVIDNVLVPEPLRSIYKEGRRTIIKRTFGLQGNSIQITRRLQTGEADKPAVKNIVNFGRSVKRVRLPTYSKFEYEGVVLSAVQLQAVAYELQHRFDLLKQPQLQLPLLRLLIRAHVVRGSGGSAAAAFRRLFSGLPRFVAPKGVAAIITQLSERRLQLTKTQVLAGLQQFYVASRCLGHIIPSNSLPGVFVYTITQYIQTLTKIPAQPFDYRFLQYLRERLATIIQQVVLVGQSVPVVGKQVDRIFSGFGGLQISVRCRRTIIRFIDNSGLIKEQVKGSDNAVEVYHRLLVSLRKRYAAGVFILTVRELTILQVRLTKYGIQISIQYLRDANAMALVGLGLFGRLKTTLTVVQVRQVLFQSIRIFLRINKVSNIPSSDFFRALFAAQHAKVPSLPVPEPPVIQTPKKYVPAPIFIVRGLTLSVANVQQIVSVLRVRFTFVSLDNVQAILAHTVLLLRASGRQVTQKNAFDVLASYYHRLPKALAIDGVDIDALLKKIDAQLVDATISGTGIQSGLVELFLHMHILKLPIPGPEVRNNFFGFCIGAYGQVQVRRQLPFGKTFYEFLVGFLPKLPGYLQPFPLFAGPQIYDAFSAQFRPARIAHSDIQLLIQTVRRVTHVKSSSLTLSYLLRIVGRASPTKVSASLSSQEVTGLLDFVKAQKLKVTQVELTRAFVICQLTVRLSSRKVRRFEVLRIFKQLVQTTVRKYNSLLVLSLVEQLVVRFRSVKVIHTPRPPRPTKSPFKKHHGFFD